MSTKGYCVTDYRLERRRRERRKKNLERAVSALLLLGMGALAAYMISTLGSVS